MEDGYTICTKIYKRIVPEHIVQDGFVMEVCGCKHKKEFPCFAPKCCQSCHDYDRQLFRDIDRPHLHAGIYKEWNKHMILHHGFPAPSNKRCGNGAHNGLFAFTLTMSPSDGLTEKELIAAAKKLMTQQSCPVKRYAWYLEYKDAARHPHIHGIYETESGGRIEAKHFRRAWPIWNESKKLGLGHRGGYHRPVVSSDDYSAYIAKDSGIHESKGFE